MRYALLNPIFEELTKEGRIRISPGKDGDLAPFNRKIKQKRVALIHEYD